MTNLQSATDWSADHLRVSLFSDVAWAEPSDAIFTGAFDGTPESVTNRPIANESSASGSWSGARLEIKKAFNRIDIILQATPVEASPIALLNDVGNLLPHFVGTVSRWAVAQSQGINRLAVGTRGFLPAIDVRDSYIKVRDLVKVINIDVDRFKEFSFQVNLPVQSSSVQNVQINRLSNWASLIFRAGLIGSENSRYLDEKYFVTCGLDINTEAERVEPYAQEDLEPLLSELNRTALQILVDGIS